MSESTSKKAPWHLWVAGVFGLLWNSYGGYDFVMSMTKGEDYLRSVGMSDEQIAYYIAMPNWMGIVWAVGVWGALLGSLLLVFRSKWAFEAFVASLLGFVTSLIYAYIIVPGPDASQAMMIMQGVIFVGCLFFACYAHFMRKAGVLR